MKILQTPARIFATGGVESYVRNLSRELVGMGHDVEVICADGPGENEVDQRIHTKTLKSRGKMANTSITPYLPLALHREDFDIIHTHLPTPWSADWSGLISRLKKRPLVLTYHNDIVGEGWAGQIAWIYNKTALKLLMKSAGGIIVTRNRYISPYLKEYAGKVFFIPLGIDVEAFRPRAAPPKGDIFFLSVLDEFHRYKGLEVLFAALKIMKQELPDVRLVVGGRGCMLDHYRRMADSLGIGDNVSFAGFIPSEKLIEYYNGCRLFALPSTDPRREGFGIVPLEAMACERPVVVTEIMGMAGDINECGAGMVVRCNDKEALASSMLAILKDDDLARRMGAEGRKLAIGKYSWRRAAEQIERVYRELL
jgi:glycosyltransferase involved in cell wall biosynthesis